MVSSPLRVVNLTKKFSVGKWHWKKAKREQMLAVDHVSFELKKGELLGILGPNGAGKTTTIAMLLGTLTPTSGSIFYFDKDFSCHRARLFSKISFASGYMKLPSRLTVWENLDIIGRLYGMPWRERRKKIDEMLDVFGIQEIKNRYTGPLSAGQMARLMLAKALLPDPEIILLDEPTAPLDPEMAHDVRHVLLQEKKRRGVSFLFTSHNMDEVTYLCDRVLVFKNGRIVADDTPRLLAASVKSARLLLTIAAGLDSAVKYLAQEQFSYDVTDHKLLSIEVDEAMIAPLLITLAQMQVIYLHLQIEKPTLQDYFIQLAKRGT